MVIKNHPKIAVIGAGLSGLTAAYRLNQKGFDVEIFEARERLGGRVFTINLNDHIGELGAQNIRDGGDAKNFLKLSHELGCETVKSKILFHLHYFQNGEILDVKDLIKKKCFAPEKLKADLKEVCKTARNMKEVLLFFFKEDDLLFKACNIMLAAYEGAPLENLSSMYSETLFHFLSGGLSAAHPNHGKEVHLEHEYVQGGNGLLCEKIGEKLQKCLHLHHILLSIKKSIDGSYHLSFENKKRISCDILILTVPCSVMKDIEIASNVIEPGERLKMEAMIYGTNAKILVPISASDAKPGAFYNGRVVSFLSGDKHSVNLFYVDRFGCFNQETIKETFHQELSMLEKVYHVKNPKSPVLAQDKSFAFYNGPVGHNWLFDPFAKGSYSCIGPDQEKNCIETIEIENETIKKLFAPISNTLFFAGEHTSTLFDVRATMEAAVESGEKAARLIEKFHLISR